MPLGLPPTVPSDAPFRLAVAGSRDLRDSAFVFDKLTHFLSQRYPDVVILHGGCRGADAIAEAWSLRFLKNPPVVFEADWPKYGKRAGPIRNEAMIADADALLAFPRYPVSLGTQDAICCAVGTRTPVVIFWLDIDEAGMVRGVKQVVSYNRKALKREVLT